MNAPVPHSAVEAETGVLGSILLDGARMLRLCDAAGITAASFHTAPHPDLYRAILALRATGAPVDQLTVKAQLRKSGRLEDIGGALFLESLVEATPTTAHGEYYIGLLRDADRRRRLAAALDRARSALEKPENGTDIVVLDLDAELDALTPTSIDGGASLVEIADRQPDVAGLLLGTEANPYLRRGGSLLIVAPSGAGKSTLGVQQDALWSIGHDCLGIPAARPLRILTVQAENDEGDAHKAAAGVLRALALSPDERAAVHARTRSYWITDATGRNCLALLESLLLRHRPDILRLDPLLAYIGADPTKPEAIADFCRKGLNTLAKRYGCGLVVMHHPPKTNRLKREDVDAWTPSDWQYFASGGADLANWARAELVLWPEGDGLFRCIAAKRWPGWRDVNGKAVFSRYIRQGREGEILWCNADTAEAEAADARRMGHRGPQRTGDLAADARALASMLADGDARKLADARRLARDRYGRSRGERAFEALRLNPSEYGLDVKNAYRNGTGFVGKPGAVSDAIATYDAPKPRKAENNPGKPEAGQA